MAELIDNKGRKWTRSQDGRELVCDDGSKVVGLPSMTDEYLLSIANISDEPTT